MYYHRIEGNVHLAKFLNEVPSPSAEKNQLAFSWFG